MKRLFAIVLTIFIVSTMSGKDILASNSYQATVTSSDVSVDGQRIWVNGFNIAGSNYFKLRDVASWFSGTPSQFDVSWNVKEKAIEVITNKAYSAAANEDRTSYSWNRSYTAKPASAAIVVNGQVRDVTAFNIEGSTYLQLRDLGKLIPFDVSYNSELNEIKLQSQVPANAYRVNTDFNIRNNQVSSYYPRWKNAQSSHLIANGDQTISVIEANEEITIETYDDEYQLVDKKAIKLELPIFGAFFSGDTYNYIAYGQENTEENDHKEVIRIVRYDKQFNRIDSVSIKGGPSYTTVPFDAGAGRMAEYGDTLVFHTSRERYTTEDGLNHQSQLTIIVNTAKMTVTNDLGKFQKNHVSHSFDQYVLFDGGNHVLLDHGDAYPRSIVLSKQAGSAYVKTDLFKIPGEIGANMTGVSIGGFEISSTSYIAAMNTVDHSLVQSYTSFQMVGLPQDQRDILVAVLPRNSSGDHAVTQRTIANYIGTNTHASIPHLVKITDNKLLVMWQEFDSDRKPTSLKYVFINQDGERLGSIQSIDHFKLSEAKPIVVNNKVVWYTNDNSTRTLYTIPLNDE